MADIRELILQAQQAQQARIEAEEAAERQRQAEAQRQMIDRLQKAIADNLPDLAEHMQYGFGPNACFSHTTDHAVLTIDEYEFHFYHGYMDHEYRLMGAISISYGEERGFYRMNRWETSYRLKEGPLQQLVLAWIGGVLAELEEEEIPF